MRIFPASPAQSLPQPVISALHILCPCGFLVYLRILSQAPGAFCFTCFRCILPASGTQSGLFSLPVQIFMLLTVDRYSFFFALFPRCTVILDPNSLAASTVRYSGQCVFRVAVCTNTVLPVPLILRHRSSSSLSRAPERYRHIASITTQLMCVPMSSWSV